MTNLRQYWNYLVDRKDLKIPSPFERVVPARVRTRREGVADKRKHFEPEDFQKLISATNDPKLFSLIYLGAYTGMRIEEICSLKVDRIKEDRIEVVDAKSEAGWRVVPIHDRLMKMIDELKSSSGDGYLISDLTFNKYGDRSNALGKKFGRLKSSLGYGRELVFHSFRKGCATQWQRKVVPEHAVSAILGHEIKTMSYGTYSGNQHDFDYLKGIVNMLDWTVPKKEKPAKLLKGIAASVLAKPLAQRP